MDHSPWTPPENIWQDYQRYQEYVHWWLNKGYRVVDARYPHKGIKAILGRQTGTALFRHRCWFWANQEEGWCLYVDKRGPSFHVLQGMTPDQAWTAFEKFKARMESPPCN